MLSLTRGAIQSNSVLLIQMYIYSLLFLIYWKKIYYVSFLDVIYRRTNILQIALSSIILILTEKILY